MSKDTKRISANEINRFIYCPYQWYYKRYYGAKELQTQYKALEKPQSKHESNFVRGLNHHKRYYTRYKIRKILLIILTLLLLTLGGIILWNTWQPVVF